MLGAIIGFPALASYDFFSGHLGPNPSFRTARDKVLMWPAVLAILATSFLALALNLNLVSGISFKKLREALGVCLWFQSAAS